MRPDLAAALATLDTCEAEHAAASCAQVAAWRASIAADEVAEVAGAAADAVDDDDAAAVEKVEYPHAVAVLAAEDANEAEFNAFLANGAAGAAEHAAADAALDLLTDHESACFFAIANPQRVYDAGNAALIRIAVNMARVGQLRPVA